MLYNPSWDKPLVKNLDLVLALIERGHCRGRMRRTRSSHVSHCLVSAIQTVVKQTERDEIYGSLYDALKPAWKHAGLNRVVIRAIDQRMFLMRFNDCTASKREVITLIHRARRGASGE